MPKRFFPLILVISTESKVRFKIVWTQQDYDAFYLRFVSQKPDVSEIKTMESYFLERTSRLINSSRP